MEQKKKLSFTAPSMLVASIGEDVASGSEEWGMGGIELFDFNDWSTGLVNLE